MVSDKSQREEHIFRGPCSNGPGVMADSLRDPSPGPHPVGYAELAVYTDGLLWLPGLRRGEAKVTEGEIHSVTKQQLPGAWVLCPLEEWGSGPRRNRTRHRRASIITVKMLPGLEPTPRRKKTDRFFFLSAAGRSGKAIKC